MIETHPHKAFIPPGVEYLLIGSFPGKDQTNKEITENDWFYGTKRNAFWKILELTYNVPLENVQQKKQLFSKLKMGITDIILKATRKQPTNSDADLLVIEFNIQEITDILDRHLLKTIYFTGNFAAKHFNKLFIAEPQQIILPSPSPRYARLTVKEKAAIYKKLLPLFVR